jgi:TolB protein
MRRSALLPQLGVLAAALLWLGLPRLAEAQLELDITEGVLEPLPIAVSEFYGAGPGSAARGREIADVVSADLERSGLFRPGIHSVA